MRLVSPNPPSRSRSSSGGSPERRPISCHVAQDGGWGPSGRVPRAPRQHGAPILHHSFPPAAAAGRADLMLTRLSLALRSGSSFSSSGVGPRTRVLALHSNSVCRGSIVLRARRALTAFGVSASVLAARPVQPSYSLSTDSRAFRRETRQRIGRRIRPRPVPWGSPLPLALDRGGSAWQGSRRSILCPTPFPWNRGEGADAQPEGEEAEEEVAREVARSGALRPTNADQTRRGTAPLRSRRARAIPLAA